MRAQTPGEARLCLLQGAFTLAGDYRETPSLPGDQSPDFLPCEAVLPFMLPCPSPSPLQIKSQDLFQRWVAQLRAHRLAQRLDMPRGSLPGTTHRKVRRALHRGSCHGDSGVVASGNHEPWGGGHCPTLSLTHCTGSWCPASSSRQRLGSTGGWTSGEGVFLAEGQ